MGIVPVCLSPSPAPASVAEVTDTSRGEREAKAAPRSARGAGDVSPGRGKAAVNAHISTGRAEKSNPTNLQVTFSAVTKGSLWREQGFLGGCHGEKEMSPERGARCAKLRWKY